jgi:isoleucyl-tRNA synthetase
MLGHVQLPSSAETKFGDLTLVDKVMMAKILKFGVQVTEAYERLDLKQVYSLIQDFTQAEISTFYLEFSKSRL